MFIVSNKKEESISILKVNYPSLIIYIFNPFNIANSLYTYVTVIFVSIALYCKMGF